VSLSSVFNRTGIVNDGSTFSGGLDGLGYALSENLVGPSVTFGGAYFALGPAGSNDDISAAGQVITLPTGYYSSLLLVGTGVNGNQASQSFTVNYTDSTSTPITQSLSDWHTPQNYTHESQIASMNYRDHSDGTKNFLAFYLYGYTFSLDSTKQVQSIKLPSDSNVEVLAIDLVRAPTHVDLSSYFNRTGIVTDGHSFTGGGLDGQGHAASSQFLSSPLTYGGASYTIGPANSNDVVSAAGQVITLPTGYYSSLSFLATGVNGNQTSLTFTVTYTDGTHDTFTQSFSDWFTPQNYQGESVAVPMTYRDNSDGTVDKRNSNFNIYAYSFALNTGKQVQSITLPSDSNVEVFAIDLIP
jgi:hypothetical protein